MRLSSLNLGLPELLPDPFAPDGLDQPWRSAIRKRPASGAVRLTRLGLEGDAVADQKHHGGPDQAVLAYAGDHYPRWRVELGDREGLVPGGFGENLTVEGGDEADVRLGDIWAVGEARLEVSQPRVPCENLARRFGVRDLVKRVVGTGRPGWYLRVLREGEVRAGEPVVLLERPHPEWSVAHAFRVMLDARGPKELRLGLARCPALPTRWRRRLGADE
ncbi:MAG TPA: MOSC domain-containing protein [Gemmatimonadales bacterium]|nr:MOSC domain-containing protein [Gemmatimonadales bacterium]